MNKKIEKEKKNDKGTQRENNCNWKSILLQQQQQKIE